MDRGRGAEWQTQRMVQMLHMTNFLQLATLGTHAFCLWDAFLSSRTWPLPSLQSQFRCLLWAIQPPAPSAVQLLCTPMAPLHTCITALSQQHLTVPCNPMQASLWTPKAGWVIRLQPVPKTGKHLLTKHMLQWMSEFLDASGLSPKFLHLLSTSPSTLGSGEAQQTLLRWEVIVVSMHFDLSLYTTYIYHYGICQDVILTSHRVTGIHNSLLFLEFNPSNIQDRVGRWKRPT